MNRTAMDSFRRLLLELSSNITTDELKSLKYACGNIIPPARAERITQTHQLFEELEKSTYLSSTNREFLASLFQGIGRPDLKNKLLGIREIPKPRMPFQTPDPSLQVFDGVPVTQELITQLLEDVSTDWKMIGRHLNIKEAVLRTIDDENRRVRNKAMEMFDAWMKNNSRNAIVPVLVTALNKTGRRDLGERVEDWAKEVNRMSAREHEIRPPVTRPVQATGQPLQNMQELDPTLYVLGATGQQPTENEPDTTPQPGTTRAQEHVQDDGPPTQPVAPPPPAAQPLNTSQPETAPPGDCCGSGSRAAGQPDEVPDAAPAGDAVSDDARIPVQVSEGSNNPDRYRTEKCLGCGSFGKVFCVKSPQDGIFWAVKLIDLRNKDRPIQEKCADVKEQVQRLAGLENQYLVQYLHTEEGDNTLAVVTTYIPGGSIQDWVRKNGKMVEPRVQMLTWKILKGLEFLHRNEIKHGRLKGANVMLDESANSVKLGDYGTDSVLQRLRESIGGHQLSSDDIHWSSPEMLQGEDVTTKTDIWSLGCTVCEMLTGHAPLANKGLNPWAIMNKYCSLNVDIPHQCSSVAYGFLGECFKTASERPSATDLLADQFPCEVEATGNPA